MSCYLFGAELSGCQIGEIRMLAKLSSIINFFIYIYVCVHVCVYIHVYKNALHARLGLKIFEIFSFKCSCG